MNHDRGTQFLSCSDNITYMRNLNYNFTNNTLNGKNVDWWVLSQMRGWKGREIISQNKVAPPTLTYCFPPSQTDFTYSFNKISRTLSFQIFLVADLVFSINVCTTTLPYCFPSAESFDFWNNFHACPEYHCICPYRDIVSCTNSGMFWNLRQNV